MRPLVFVPIKALQVEYLSVSGRLKVGSVPFLEAWGRE